MGVAQLLPGERDSAAGHPGRGVEEEESLGHALEETGEYVAALDVRHFMGEHTGQLSFGKGSQLAVGD